ncbi:LAME_0F02652g1_1 [Lachancea meyersii CBS 8951]|uniref:LAME_0F02652g1_1 n=1 Tax=Lachancea meyersii CBS 8951 TaxID=1266667 RepID=A0A1G4JQN4_9SACH|nr:LAME_0F02652g1_1 [Lachancea meyersii CBS 8951]
MLFPGLEDCTAFNQRPAFLQKRRQSGPSLMTPPSTNASSSAAQPPMQAELSQHANHAADATDNMEPLINLYYPMATASSDIYPWDRPYTSHLFSFTTESPSSLYDVDFYASGFGSRSGSINYVSDRKSAPTLPTYHSGPQWPAHANPHTAYASGTENNSMSFQQGSPESSTLGIVSAVHGFMGSEDPIDYYQHTPIAYPQHKSHGCETANSVPLSDNSAFQIFDENIEASGHLTGQHYDQEGDFIDEEAENSDVDHRNSNSLQSGHFSSHNSSYSGLASQMSQAFYAGSNNGGMGNNRRVSDSRLSAQGLAQVLNLDSAEEALRRERFILDIFERELHYPLGYKTWVRDTSKEYRTQLLDQLHRRVIQTYPEYDKPVLETIIRRATYYMMQSRLRRERRAKAKQKKDQDRTNRDSKNTSLDDSFESGNEHQADFSAPAFMM